jgi:hypothetical protein
MDNYICDDNWIYFEANTSEIYEIIKFDDGNEQYEQYDNTWVIYGTWRGKCAIYNINRPEIKINSISNWKISINLKNKYKFGK